MKPRIGVSERSSHTTARNEVQMELRQFRKKLEWLAYITIAVWIAAKIWKPLLPDMSDSFFWLAIVAGSTLGQPKELVNSFIGAFLERFIETIL